MVIHDTCKAINLTFSEFIVFSTGRELDKAIEGFQEKWDVNQCVGAIDGSYIPVTAPSGQHTDVYNRKEWFSIIIQSGP